MPGVQNDLQNEEMAHLVEELRAAHRVPEGQLQALHHAEYAVALLHANQAAVVCDLRTRVNGVSQQPQSTIAHGNPCNGMPLTYSYVSFSRHACMAANSHCAMYSLMHWFYIL